MLELSDEIGSLRGEPEKVVDRIEQERLAQGGVYRLTIRDSTPSEGCLQDRCWLLSMSLQDQDCQSEIQPHQVASEFYNMVNLGR